jgi:hypothetical protein
MINLEQRLKQKAYGDVKRFSGEQVEKLRRELVGNDTIWISANYKIIEQSGKEELKLVKQGMKKERIEIIKLARKMGGRYVEEIVQDYGISFIPKKRNEYKVYYAYLWQALCDKRKKS